MKLETVLLFAGFLSCSRGAPEVLVRKPRTILRTEVKTPTQMATQNGYPSETHYVTTEDDYILKMHRIPRGRYESEDSTKTKPVVFLMHCIFCSSADWLMNYPEDALGFYLADQGFDVWMGNARGNTYAHNHTFYDLKSRQYWDFSFHEIAVKDLPASIDHILRATGATQIHYVGYSMGVVVCFVMLSEKPEYNQKVKSAAMLGPASTLKNNGALPFKFAPFVNLIELAANVLGIREIMGQNFLINTFATTTCSRQNSFLNQFCKSMFSIIIDIDDKLVNQEFLPIIFSHMPAGGSLKTMLHFMQLKNTNRFQQYDYGSRKNRLKYGSNIPKKYNITNVKIPIGLYYGSADKYVPPKDVNRIAKLLPNVARMYEVPHPDFSHFDFLWARNVTNLLNKDIVNFFQKYD